MEAQLASEGVDVKGVTNVMEEMSRRNRELFALPPYVLYVARAFSTLEGIGLTIDEDYAIVQECYPYLARRLFTDRSPRAKAALRAMLGLDGAAAPSATSAPSQPSLLPFAADGGVRGVVTPTTTAGGAAGGLSPAKLVEMSEQFRTATAATADVDASAGQTEATREFARLVLGKEGSTLQDILVEESAKLGDAALRQALRAALVDAPSSVASPLGLSPPPALVELLSASDEDARVLATGRELRELLGPRVQQQLNSSATTPVLAPTAVTDAFGSLLSDETTRNDVLAGVEGAGAVSRRIGATMLRRAAARAANTPGLPETARDAYIDVNNKLADAVEPKAPLDATAIES